MAKYGFLRYWTRKWEELSFWLWDKLGQEESRGGSSLFPWGAKNPGGIETVDAEGNASAEDIYFEEAVLFYNPVKSRFETEDYLAALPYEPRRGSHGSFWLISWIF